MVRAYYEKYLGWKKTAKLTSDCLRNIIHLICEMTVGGRKVKRTKKPSYLGERGEQKLGLQAHIDLKTRSYNSIHHQGNEIRETAGNMSTYFLGSKSPDSDQPKKLKMLTFWRKITPTQISTLKSRDFTSFQQQRLNKCQFFSVVVGWCGELTVLLSLEEFDACEQQREKTWESWTVGIKPVSAFPAQTTLDF